MKIQIEAYGKKHTFECDYDDLTTEEIILWNRLFHLSPNYGDDADRGQENKCGGASGPDGNEEAPSGA